MLIKIKNKGYTAIEFLLSAIALFLLILITVPIFAKYREWRCVDLIKQNLIEISYYADRYFEDNSSNLVSIYEFIGPRKSIPELEIIADEEYPEIIFRDKVIFAHSKKYGDIILKKSPSVKK